MAKIPTPTLIPLHAIALPTAAATGHSTADGRVVVREAEGAWELVWGLGTLQRASGAGVEAWVVSCSAPHADALQTADQNLELDWVGAADVCAMLRAAGLPNRVVAAALNATPAEVSRLTRLSNSCDTLREFIRNGQLSPGHGRVIAMLPFAQQERWARQVLAHGWSVRGLEESLREARNDQARKAAPDSARFLELLGEVLGTRAELHGGCLRLACYSAEEAKGLMERLAKGPELNAPASASPMWLSIPAPDNDQLYALTGHLVPNE